MGAEYFTYKMQAFFLATIIVVSLKCSQAFCAPPFMNFEGVGGAGIVPGAYLVNPPDDEKPIGTPAFSHWSIIGGNNNIYTFASAFSFAKRFELGYAMEINDFRRLRHDLRRDSNGTLDVEKSTIFMSNIHLKALLLEEKKYFPAFAFTAELKLNHTIDTMNNNIGQALSTVGYDDDKGIDLDFSFSKTIKELFYFPCMINANLRLTRGHYLGFLGFSSDYTANGELSICFMPNSKVGLGGEVRQQNDDFDPLPLSGYTMKEDAFWDVFVAFFPTQRFSLALAFCRFGNIVNKDINFFVCNLKYDFN